MALLLLLLLLLLLPMQVPCSPSPSADSKSSPSPSPSPATITTTASITLPAVSVQAPYTNVQVGRKLHNVAVKAGSVSGAHLTATLAGSATHTYCARPVLAERHAAAS